MTSPVAPSIDASGITAPTYAQILDYLNSQYQAIFGLDAYIDPDSQDGQFIAIIAQAITDCIGTAIAVYNSFSPQTAQGAGLSSVVKINGLQRLTPSFSTATLTLTGTAGTSITNGQATDASGNTWALPPRVSIPDAGSTTALATCTTVGAITAPAGTITGIGTPVYGWQSVTNAADAVPGAPVETDAALRVRQSRSTTLPSVTIFEGIVASIAATAGVTRCRGYENNTAATDANGQPARSLTFVVEGGADLDIQTAIAAKIPPGIPGNGDHSATITDATGSTRVVSFYRPTESAIAIALGVHGLPGWSTAAEPYIQAALVNWLNSLPIGQTVSYTQAIAQAYKIGPPYQGTYNITSLTLCKSGGTPGTSDLTVAYTEVATGVTSDITFTVS